jgi:hypothetical protein
VSVVDGDAGASKEVGMSSWVCCGPGTLHYVQ